MNRNWVVLAKMERLHNIPDKRKLWYAESNSPNDELRLAGRPEIQEAIEILLNMLPPTYSKKDTLKLVEETVNKVFI